MADVTLFISDLHLCAERPAITALFLEFLKNEARRARALYILGDLFEFWIGDEAADTAEFRPMIKGLRELADSGVPMYAMHGNRDFLLGAGFEKASGCKLLPDPSVIDLYGERVLLVHGDSLCTRDTDHMKFRDMVRDPTWQSTLLAKPLAEREAIARQYREMSRAMSATKELDIMDVEQSTVEAVMREHGVRRMIHGHTHRPAQHRFSLDNATAHRTVLGDWYEQGSLLRATPDAQTLEGLPIANRGQW
jgi:UDP-2,3-diacylglucosamine hydrolase